MEHRTDRIVRNTALYTSAVIGQKTLSFLYFWFLSSHFGPADLGGYLRMLSLVGLFSIGIDLGTTAILTREGARHEADALRMIKNVLALKIPLAILTAAALSFTVIRTWPFGVLFLPVAVGILLSDAFTTSFFAGLRARQALSYEAAVLVLFQIIVFASGVALTLATGDLRLVMAALLVGSLFGLVFMGWAVRRVYGALPWPSFDRATIRHLMSLVPAFAGGIIFTKIYAVADVTLLGYLAGDREVGLYSVPAKVVTALQSLLPGAFAAAIYPSMANYFSTAPEKLKTLFEKSAGYLLILALPIATGLTLLAGKILAVIWPNYQDARAAFVAIMLGLPFMFLSFPTGSLLNASGREKRNTGNRAAVTVANILLNLLLIPKMGVVGAAVTFTVSNILLLSLDLAVVLRLVSVDLRAILNLFWKGMAASAVMAAAIILLRERIPLPVMIVLGAVVYSISAAALRLISREEWRALLGLIRRREPSAAAEI